jgi:hypothetical protein
MMASGGQTIPLYEKLNPLLSAPFESQAATAYLSKAVSTLWRDWYICAYPATGSTTNNRCFAYHIPTMTFTTLDHSSNLPTYASFAVDASGVLYAGDASNAGKVWKMFTNAGSNTYWTATWVPTGGGSWTSGVGMACKYKSPILSFQKHTKIERIVVWTSRPSASQTLSVDLYPECASSATAYSKTLASTGTDGRIKVVADSGVTCKTFQVGVSGTFTVPVTIYSIRIDFSGDGSIDTDS